MYPNIEAFDGIYNIQPTTKDRLQQQLDCAIKYFGNNYTVYHLETYVKSMNNNSEVVNDE